MPQKFFENTLQSKFIKNLVRNYNIPSVSTVRDGDFVIKDFIYIYRSSFIKCTKTGVLDERKQYVKAVCSEELKASENVLVSDVNIVTADYEELEFFRLGLHYPNLTETYTSRTSYYDSTTHYYLGNLLRAIRDLLHIDLMPFYNCFSAQTANIKVLDGTTSIDSLDNIYFNPPFVELNSDRKYKTYIVPIKFNKIYTIAIDSPTEVRIAPVLFDGDDFIRDSDGLNLSDSIDSKPLILGSTSFKNPITYEVKNRDFKLQSNEKFLYLAIQMYANLKTSIVVLEGDYTEPGYKTYNHEYTDRLSYKEQDRLFLSSLSLLQLSDGNSYAFSDRLIEYLLLNVITYQDEISDNIKRVQKYISDSTKKNNYIKVGRYKFMPYNGKSTGIWDDNLRAALFDIYMHNGSNKLDINGFVDKDVEKLITQGFDV